MLEDVQGRISTDMNESILVQRRTVLDEVGGIIGDGAVATGTVRRGSVAVAMGGGAEKGSPVPSQGMETASLRAREIHDGRSQAPSRCRPVKSALATVGVPSDLVYNLSLFPSS